MSLERIKLWDLPTRLFHWLLVILINAAVVTAKIGGNAMDWHGRIGLSILGLIAFRLVWGFIGSHHSRFVNFIPTPASVRGYLRGHWQGIGHNPLGALSVVALLGLICVQVLTGLFSNDDISFNGPLFNLVSKELSDQLTGVHKLSINALVALSVLHLGAIAFYTFLKKDNLVKPMITGWKEIGLIEAQSGKSVKGGGMIAFVIALLIALSVVFIGSGTWLPQAPKPVQSPTPAASSW